QIELNHELPAGPATLGVRPEDFLAASEPPGSSRRFATVSVDVVEHMGHETIAHFALGGAEHVAPPPADARVPPGDRLPLAVRPGAWHIFSTVDGTRLK